jgi:type IV secretory pathway TraG/TraD family ATPase VirD4
MLHQELMQMPLDEQVIIRPGMPPMKTKRMCWYSDRRFSLLKRPPPVIPQLNISVQMVGGSSRSISGPID